MACLGNFLFNHMVIRRGFYVISFNVLVKLAYGKKIFTILDFNIDIY